MHVFCIKSFVFACYNFHIFVLNGMTEDNKTFSFYLSKGTMLYCM